MRTRVTASSITPLVAVVGFATGVSATPIFTEDWSAAPVPPTFDAQTISERWPVTNYYLNPTVPGWTFGGTAVLSINDANNDKAMALNESPTPGSMSTTVSGFTVGEPYLLTFEHWGDDRPDTTAYVFDVLLDATLLGQISRAYSFPGPGATDSFLFVASATSHVLSFADVTPVGEASALIDNISISQVPEPGTGALVLSVLLGFGVVRRRRAR